MEEELGCWYSKVFIACDGCKYGSDAVGCASFRKAFFAKYGHENLVHGKKRVDNRNSAWK